MHTFQLKPIMKASLLFLFKADSENVIGIINPHADKFSAELAKSFKTHPGDRSHRGVRGLKYQTCDQLAIEKLLLTFNESSFYRTTFQTRLFSITNVTSRPNFPNVFKDLFVLFVCSCHS